MILLAAISQNQSYEEIELLLFNHDQPQDLLEQTDQNGLTPLQAVAGGSKLCPIQLFLPVLIEHIENDEDEDMLAPVRIGRRGVGELTEKTDVTQTNEQKQELKQTEDNDLKLLQLFLSYRPQVC